MNFLRVANWNARFFYPILPSNLTFFSPPLRKLKEKSAPRPAVKMVLPDLTQNRKRLRREKGCDAIDERRENKENKPHTCARLVASKSWPALPMIPSTHKSCVLPTNLYFANIFVNGCSEGARKVPNVTAISESMRGGPFDWGSRSTDIPASLAGIPTSSTDRVVYPKIPVGGKPVELLRFAYG